MNSRKSAGGGTIPTGWEILKRRDQVGLAAETLQVVATAVLRRAPRRSGCGPARCRAAPAPGRC